MVITKSDLLIAIQLCRQRLKSHPDKIYFWTCIGISKKLGISQYRFRHIYLENHAFKEWYKWLAHQLKLHSDEDRVLWGILSNTEQFVNFSGLLLSRMYEKDLTRCIYKSRLAWLASLKQCVEAGPEKYEFED